MKDLPAIMMLGRETKYILAVLEHERRIHGAKGGESQHVDDWFLTPGKAEEGNWPDEEGMQWHDEKDEAEEEEGYPPVEWEKKAEDDNTGGGGVRLDRVERRMAAMDLDEEEGGVSLQQVEDRLAGMDLV